MKNGSSKLLSLLNKSMYFIGCAMLVSAAILTLVFHQAQAQNPGSVWTNGDSVCSNQQNQNAYNPGDSIYIHYRDFLPGNYDWSIRPPSNASSPVASGQITITSTGFGCLFAYIIAPDDEGEYTYDLGNKNDNYHVCGNGKVWDGQHCIAPTTTTVPTSTHTATSTSTATPTATSTATNTATPTPTNTATATATSSPTNTLTSTATLHGTDPSTGTATATARPPTATPKPPTPPTNTPVPTKVSTLPIPPTGGTPLIIPVTGNESASASPMGTLTRGLFLGGLAVLGYAALFSGLRKMLKH